MCAYHIHSSAWGHSTCLHHHHPPLPPPSLGNQPASQPASHPPTLGNQPASQPATLGNQPATHPPTLGNHPATQPPTHRVNQFPYGHPKLMDGRHQDHTARCQAAEQLQGGEEGARGGLCLWVGGTGELRVTSKPGSLPERVLSGGCTVYTWSHTHTPCCLHAQHNNSQRDMYEHPPPHPTCTRTCMTLRAADE